MRESTLPWHREQWEYICRLMSANSVPHAILITGAEGVGKTSFANRLSAALLCEQTTADGNACGECKYCKLFSATTHPDFIYIAPEDSDKVISVEDIRELIDRLSLTSHFKRAKVALIENADAMNINAANALLKTLEEPPAETVIILVCKKPQRLMATVRSRCQIITINSPNTEEAIQWLAQQRSDIDWQPLLAVANGAPLQALALHETELLEQRTMVIEGLIDIFNNNTSPLDVAARLESVAVIQGVQWIQGVLLDLLRLKSVENPITLENPDFYRSLLAIAPRLEVRLLLDFWDWLLERKRVFDNSLNRRLFMEEIFLYGRQSFGKT